MWRRIIMIRYDEKNFEWTFSSYEKAYFQEEKIK